MRGGSYVGIFDDVFDRGKFVIDADGEVERVFVGLELRLIDGFFDRGQLIGKVFGALFYLVVGNGEIGLELIFSGADGDDARVGVGDAVANLEGESQLLVEVFLGGGRSGILDNGEILREGLAVDDELDLIVAGRGDGTGERAIPHEESGEAGSVFVAKVPDEAVEAGFGGQGSVAGAEVFVLDTLVTFGFGGDFADKLAVGGEEAELQLAFRFAFEVVVNDRAVGGIGAFVRAGPAEAVVAVDTNGALDGEEEDVGGALEAGGVEGADQRKIIEDVEAAALGGEDHVVLLLLEGDVGDGDGREIELEGKPVVAVIVGDI